MANAPWYMSDGVGVPTLKHHKVPAYNNDPSKLQERFQRGTKAVRLLFFFHLSLFTSY